MLVDVSSIGPEAVREVAGLLPDGVTSGDAPVMGSVDKAARGELTQFVGGDADAVVPLLETFGTVRRTGALGSGAALGGLRPKVRTTRSS